MSMRLKLLRKTRGHAGDPGRQDRPDQELPVQGRARAEHAVHCRRAEAGEGVERAGGGAVLRGKRRCRRLQHRSSRPAQVAVQRRRRPGLRLPRAADRRPRAVAVHRPPPRDFSHSTFKEHLGEEFIFVHEGQVEVDFMNQRIILERGDALHFNAQKPHRIRSLGDPGGIAGGDPQRRMRRRLRSIRCLLTFCSIIELLIDYRIVSPRTPA